MVHVTRTSLPWIVLPRIGLVPRWAAIALIVVAMDGCNWAVHLANHRSRMLWRFHELHHSQEDMSVLTVFRTHPLIHFSYLVALLPGVVLLANGAMSITVLVVYGAIVAFAHSNTRLGFGPLERIFVSPNFHRIHHKVDGPADVNLGFALTIWDQLFHRAVFPTEDTIRTDTGLAGRPLDRRAGGAASEASLGLRRPDGGAVPSDAYRHRPPAGAGVRARGRAPGHDLRRWWETLASPRRPSRGRRVRGRVMVTTSVPKAPSRSRELLRILFSTRTAALPADLCLLVVRLVLAWIFIYHGSRRLFGWFGGLGIHEYGNYFANTAHLHPGELFAVLSGVIEFGGGIALALGLFSRLAGLAIFGDMMGAIITVTWANGINATGGTAGYELNLALGFLALVPAVFGAGRFSVDAELERRLVRADATATAERSRRDSPAY